MQRTLSLGTLAVGLVANLAFAQSIVIPNGLSAAEGNSSTGYPWGYGSSNSTRVQYVYDSTHFTAQGISGPIVINTIRWRADGNSTTAGYVYNNAEVKLSTAPIDHASITTTFASNHGADLATVHTGPVTVQTPAGTSPNSYYVDIPITPFVYDPTLGDLNVDLACDGTGPTVTTGPYMDCQTTGTMCHRMYNLSNWQAVTGSIQANVGVTIELDFTPAQGIYPGFSATPTSGSIPLTVNFTDASYSSDPNGILAWAWDFENDGTIDSTLEDPTHIYNTCGNYDVALTVIDATNGAATHTELGLITVGQIAVDFTATPTSGYVPLIVNFTDASSGATSWAWDFEDDGIIDATQQNPIWAYALPGSYTVSLTVSNGCLTASETKVNYITTGQQGARPLQPEILQLQFNEFRGSDVANTATSGAIAPNLAVNISTWQGDAARPRFRGNYPATGCFEAPAAVDTGWPVSITGSFSIGFWIRSDAGNTSNPFGYVFSDGTFRAFAAGASGTGMLFRGSPLADFNSNNNIVNSPAGQWVHMLLVVDDAAGMATWYSDGQVTNTKAFPAGTFTYSGGSLKVGASSATGGSSIGTDWAIDDFRMYNRALQAFDAQALFLESEHATAGAFGTSCPTTAGDIDIAGMGGFPTSGNTSFMVQASNLEPGQLTALILGVFPSTAPVLNLDPWLTGPGCELQIDNLGLLIGVPSAANTFTLPIPIPAGLVPTHIYVQAVQYGSAGGGVSKVLDVNIQD